LDERDGVIRAFLELTVNVVLDGNLIHIEPLLSGPARAGGFSLEDTVAVSSRRGRAAHDTVARNMKVGEENGDADGGMAIPKELKAKIQSSFREENQKRRRLSEKKADAHSKCGGHERRLDGALRASIRGLRSAGIAKVEHGSWVLDIQISATRFDAAVWTWGRAWRIPDRSGRVLSGWVGLLVDAEGIEHAFGGHRIVGSFNQTIEEWPAMESGALGSPNSDSGIKRICEKQRVSLVAALAKFLE
jgi:hypothetical protein